MAKTVDENAVSRNTGNEQELEGLFLALHQALIECQRLGDEKIRLSSQVIEAITNKTRQLGFDNKNNGKLLLTNRLVTIITF